MAMLIRQNIAAPLPAVWELLVDTRYWPQWGPSVLAVDCATTHISAGSHGRVRTAAGIWLPFAIDQFAEPHYWSWRVCGIPATGHRLRRQRDGSSELIFEVPWLAAPYSVVCRIAAQRIAALSQHHSHD